MAEQVYDNYQPIQVQMPDIIGEFEQRRLNRAREEFLQTRNNNKQVTPPSLKLTESPRHGYNAIAGYLALAPSMVDENEAAQYGQNAPSFKSVQNGATLLGKTIKNASDDIEKIEEQMFLANPEALRLPQNEAILYETKRFLNAIDGGLPENISKTKEFAYTIDEDVLKNDFPEIYAEASEDPKTQVFEIDGKRKVAISGNMFAKHARVDAEELIVKGIGLKRAQAQRFDRYQDEVTIGADGVTTTTRKGGIKVEATKKRLLSLYYGKDGTPNNLAVNYAIDRDLDPNDANALIEDMMSIMEGGTEYGAYKKTTTDDKNTEKPIIQETDRAIGGKKVGSRFYIKYEKSHPITPITTESGEVYEMKVAHIEYIKDNGIVGYDDGAGFYVTGNVGSGENEETITVKVSEGSANATARAAKTSAQAIKSRALGTQSAPKKEETQKTSQAPKKEEKGGGGANPIGVGGLNP